MREEARRATEDDVDVLVRLYRDGAEEMAVLKEAWLALDARPEPVAESFRADVGSPTSAVFIGTIDDAPVGYAAVRLEERLPQTGGLHARVRDVYVEPGARGVGVGEELIGAVIAWAEEHGAKSAEIRVLPGHRDAKNFCERNGFTARLLLMHRNL